VNLVSRARTTLGVARRTWRFLGAPDGAPRAELESFLLDRLVRRPIVFEDGRGLRYVLEPGENAGAFLRAGGNYEVAETRFCEQVVRPGATAFDVGAHIGLYTLLLARLVGPEGRVHAFEPEPRNHGRLLANLALNGADNVSARQAAVYARTSGVELNVFGAGFGAWHSLGRPRLPDPFAPGRTVEPVETIEVEAVALDDYCAEAGVERIDFLKVDVEGAERDVLEGARGLLAAGGVGVILFEASLPQTEALGHGPAEVFELLAGHGYRSFALDEAGRPAHEVSAATERYGNYVAAREPADLGRG
jgi:FkbM family methyltransferase